MRAIIVDDELKSREVLRTLVETFCDDIEVVCTCEDIDDSIAAIKREKPDLVFLDIHLKNGDSFQILKGLDDLNFDIIFVTAYDEYSVKALKFTGITCLFKPIDVDELVQAISSLREKHLDMHTAYEMVDGLLRSKFSKVPIITPTGLTFVGIENILYLRSLDKGVELHTTDGHVTRSIKDLSIFREVFITKDFIPVGEGLLVNSNWIDRSKSDRGVMVFRNGATLEVQKELLYNTLKAMIGKA